MWKDAVEAFRKALELNPYFVDVRNDLGTALVLSGKREEGRKEFLNAFSDATNPTPEISSRNLGQSYLEDKNYPEAMQWFRTSIARNKIYADPYLGMADALIATGHTEEAIVQLEAGVREAPDDPALLTASAGAVEGRPLQRGPHQPGGRGPQGPERPLGPASPGRLEDGSQVGGSLLPYLAILERLLRAVAGAEAALLLDPNGKSWCRREAATSVTG
jgi:tetratricopeptide (TPR) repeat protein